LRIVVKLLQKTDGKRFHKAATAGRHVREQSGSHSGPPLAARRAGHEEVNYLRARFA